MYNAVYIYTKLIIIIVSLFKSTAWLDKLKGPHLTFSTRPYQVSVYSRLRQQNFISSLHLFLCLTRLLIPFLGCHSVTLTVHLLSVWHVTCPAYVHPFFNCNQDVFYFHGLIPNPWCFLPISPCFAKHYSLHSKESRFQIHMVVLVSSTDDIVFSIVIGNYFHWNALSFEKLNECCEVSK